MASKSKRRRRVLGASCILAALIVAGSSFAWFTSKDEVTNRLTASADYNVVAIENFVPPQQWVPGQTVTKEEAVTNTGNIDAFVKQTITGDLKVTVEIPSTVAPTLASTDYIELNTQAKFGSLEAGSVLAWKPEEDETNKLGKIIDFGIDGATDTNHDFEPAATGLYIFRRAIQKNENDNGVKSYEYVGYYYVKGNDTTPGKYFKLHALNVSDDNLDKDTDGLLKSAPAYSFAKKITTDQKNVDMYFLEPTEGATGDEADYRLKLVYNAAAATDAAAASEAANNNKAVYDLYQDYLDKLQGKTTYVPTNPWTQPTGATARTDDLRALDPKNETGIIDHDKYDQDEANAAQLKVPNTNLSNFSYKRLEDLKYGNNATVENYGDYLKDGNGTSVANPENYGLMGLYNNASPATDDTNDTVEKAWNAVEKTAETSRQTVNTGVQAAADLANIKTAVQAAIGRSDDATTNPTTGLKLTRTDADASTDPVGKNTWSADLLGTGDTVKDPVAFGLAFDTGEDVTVDNVTEFDATKIYFKTTSAGLTAENAVNSTMTADNVLEKRFKDNANAFGAPNNDGSQVIFTEPTSPTRANSGAFKEAWDAYVQQTKRKLLIEKKIELVTASKAEGGVLTETNVARSVKEADRILAVLKDEQTAIMKDYNEAKKAYETAAQTVVDNIATMNTLQAKVDSANKEYNEYIVDPNNNDFTYDADKDTITIAEKDDIVINVLKGDGTANGQADTPSEDTFEGYLRAAYGAAHKDADTTGYASTYTATKVTPPPTDRTTYSRSVTETDIKGATTVKMTGDGADGTSTFTSGTKFTAPETAASVTQAPYFRIYEADNMMKFRKGQYEKSKNQFDAKTTEMGLTSLDENKKDIVLYIGLDDVVKGATATDNNTWEYIGDATKDKTANAFDFGYSGVVKAGETSDKLIKYVKFDESVKQDAFIDMVFDINVGVESAQVVYNGTRVGAQSAQASLSPIIPTANEYADADAQVDWSKRTDAVATGDVINDEDPNPKADANVPASTPNP